MQTLYSILGVEPTATPEEIKAAYRTAAKANHSDAGGDDEAMKEINAAYEVLSDPEKRKRYDETGAVGEAPISEAQRNLVSMFAGFVKSYAPGTNLIKKLRAEVDRNLVDFRYARQQAIETAAGLRDAQSRIIFRGEGPNLFAEVVAGEIIRLETTVTQLDEALKTGAEMLRILEPYSFREDTPTWDFAVPMIGGKHVVPRKLHGILQQLREG